MAPSETQNILGPLLSQVEMVAHSGGWDQPGWLLLLYDATHTPTDRVYRTLMGAHGNPIRCHHGYAAQPVMTFHHNPSHELYSAALRLTYHPDNVAVKTIRTLFRTPGYRGVAAIYEAWMAPTPQAPTHPDQVEIRSLLAATNHGDYHILRRRGQRPEAVNVARGAMLESLHVIHAAITDQPLPPLTVQPVDWPPRGADDDR